MNELKSPSYYIFLILFICMNLSLGGFLGLSNSKKFVYYRWVHNHNYIHNTSWWACVGTFGVFPGSVPWKYLPKTSWCVWFWGLKRNITSHSGWQSKQAKPAYCSFNFPHLSQMNVNHFHTHSANHVQFNGHPSMITEPEIQRTH